MHPVVDAVQAPMVSEVIVHVPPKFIVAVHVVPPTQVAASSVTVSDAPGTLAPVAPPEEADHIEVSAAVIVHAVVHTKKREAASALVHRESSVTSSNTNLAMSFVSDVDVHC